jgi:hypothetical protein
MDEKLNKFFEIYCFVYINIKTIYLNESTEEY